MNDIKTNTNMTIDLRGNKDFETEQELIKRGFL